jgi:hypothetical protein
MLLEPAILERSIRKKHYKYIVKLFQIFQILPEENVRHNVSKVKTVRDEEQLEPI